MLSEQLCLWLSKFFIPAVLSSIQVKQDTKNEVLVITRQRIEIQQELENIKNIQARELKEHEQVRYVPGTIGVCWWYMMARGSVIQNGQWICGTMVKWFCGAMVCGTFICDTTIFNKVGGGAR